MIGFQGVVNVSKFMRDNKVMNEWDWGFSVIRVGMDEKIMG